MPSFSLAPSLAPPDVESQAHIGLLSAAAQAQSPEVAQAHAAAAEFEAAESARGVTGSRFISVSLH